MKRLSLFILFIWSSWALAQGGIPIKYMNDPAVDLVHKEKVLLPEEVHELIEKTKGRFDISTLNPVESSDLWKDVFLEKLPQDQNPILDMDEVKYHSPVLSPTGIFRFNIENGEDGKLYTMMLSKTVHSVLLAKGLLRKIGYQIPDIKYLPRVIISFKDEAHKKGFISYLENIAFAGAPKNWIVEELEDNKLLLQDLIVMDSNHTIYNLAVGVTNDMIQGRRLLSSLAVPLSLVNLTESVNMLRWNVGIKNGNEITLFHDQLSEFQCSWDDARWITRRIEKLSRKDWEEIVEGSHTPKAVQQILVEKLISRRNSAMKLFKIDAKSFKVDSDIDNGVELVDGKLTQQNWPGYASRFAYGDPDSPLAASEMRSFIKSKVISTLMELAVAQINQLPFLGTDIQKINEQHFEKEINKAIARSIETKTPFEVPLKAWVFPTFRGNMILSRNIVTGTYLGTDNLVQLADTVGVAVAAGAFVGTMGLPTPVKGFAQGEAQFVRTYSHLRPVTSIQKSLKYPFKNVFVPLVKMDYGSKLHEAANVAIDPDASEEVKAEKIEAALKPFKDAMDVGESILVTDAIAAYVGGKLSVGYEKLVTASLSLSPGYNVVSRFHVHRKSEHDFQIYKDLGHVGSLGFNFDLDSLVPVLSVSFKKSRGKARVKFYSLNLHPKNPDVLKNTSMLRRAIVSSSVREMEEEEKYKPYILKHDFKESSPKINLFFWQWQWQNSLTNITVQNPQGDERYFRRQYHGMTKGRDYQKYVNATIAHWVNMLFDRKAGLSQGGDNPGYSFKGRAETRYLSLDEEVSRDGDKIEPFVRLSRVFNGWSITQEKAEKILDELRQRYRHDFFNAPVLNDTQRIFLYNISLNVFFYKNGIEHLLAMNEEEIKRIFRENMAQTNLVINPANVDDNDTGVYKFLRFLARFKKYENKGNWEKANKYLMKALSQAEYKVNLNGLVALMGGEENIFVNSRIDGFREGDEDGDKALISNSLGEFGSSNILGPVVQLQRQTEMIEGEFFIYWMMKRLI
ncbi:MAG: hypothetical protein ACLGHN_01135 [Bacteriovoracia bacterium]